MQNLILSIPLGRIVFLFPFLLLSLMGLAQPTFDIDHIETKELIPMDYLSVLVDSTEQLNITDILASEYQAQFKGYTPLEMKVKNATTAYWAKFKLKGKCLLDKHWVLEAPDCNISFLDLYYTIDGELTKVMQAGSLRPHGNRNFKHKNFVAELPKTNEEIEFYARISSDIQNQFLFHVIRYKHFTGYALSEYILLGAFYGIIFIMGLYNFFLFIVNKTKINLWYFIYAISCMLVCTIEDGLGFQYIWPGYPRVNFLLMHHAPNILLVCFLIYATHFLELNKRQPNFLKLILGISFISMLPSFSSSNFLNDTFSGTYFIPFMFLYVANIKSVRRGFLPAKYFLFAFTFTIMGIFVLCFRRFGSIDWSSLGALQIIFLVYALNFALLAEVVLLSIAQALKVGYEQQKQKKILSDKEVRLRNIFNSSFDALLVYDPDTEQIIGANNRSAELFQYNVAELQSTDIAEIIKLPADFKSRQSTTIKDLILDMEASNINQFFEADCADAFGETISCEITLSPLQEGNSNAYVIAIKDITERKEAQEDLKVKMAEISEKNERLQAYISSNSELENFAYVASHDMKQPIRSIKSFTQVLKQHLIKKDHQDKASEEYINFIIGATNNLDSLIVGLLEHARISSMKEVSFKSFSIEDIMNNVQLNLNQQITENNVTIICENLPTLQLERVRIIQLLQNLFSNAIKFRKKDVGCVIKLQAEEQKEHWLFKLEDNGIGIEQKYQDKIFQIFKKLHDASTYSGNGIGLATCKKIVEQHGGTIWVKSEFGKGTTFFFTIKKDLDTFNLMLVSNKEEVLN